MNRLNYIVHVQRIKYTLASPSTAPEFPARSIAITQKSSSHASESSMVVTVSLYFISLHLHLH